MKKCLVGLCLISAFALFAQSKTTPYVILISLDGFRYDYVAKFNPPHFKEFIKRGAAAEALIPSFPSKTFPNHYTLVTGLYPGHHGLVDNQFYDPELQKAYGMKDQENVANPAYYGGTPLWQLAQEHGMKSASFFWVGSEALVKGRFPDYYYKYSDTVSNEKRVTQAIDWLQLPEPQRPHFISLYFSLVDTEGHKTGPDSPQLRQTVLKADSLLGNLISRLKSIDLPVNVILVSDHGMAELKQQEPSFITLSKLFNINNKEVIFANGGTQAHLYTRQKDSLYTVLKKKEAHFKVYKREEFPAQWNYNHPRSGDLMIVADPGYYIQVVPRDAKHPFTGAVFGAHGFDPYVVKEMGGIFYAAGPNIAAGVSIQPFGNIHVYPFIAKILGLKTPPIDGDAKVLEPIYKK